MCVYVCVCVCLCVHTEGHINRCQLWQKVITSSSPHLGYCSCGLGILGVWGILWPIFLGLWIFGEQQDQISFLGSVEPNINTVGPLPLMFLHLLESLLPVIVFFLMSSVPGISQACLTSINVVINLQLLLLWLCWVVCRSGPRSVIKSCRWLLYIQISA